MTTTTEDERREADRADLLDTIDAHARAGKPVPCMDGDAWVTAAWTAEDDAEQAVAAAACRATPCPALTDCRRYGLAWPGEAGAYGGLTHQQRRKAARKGDAAA